MEIRGLSGKLSSHFAYLENRSRGLDVTWQAVRGELTVRPWTVSHPVGLVSRQWDAVDWACVLCDCRIHKSSPFRRWFHLWEKPKVAESQIWAVGRLTDPGDVMLCQKESLYESCRIGRRIVVMKVICSLGHCECDSHSVHNLSQRSLTVDWLAPRETDCSRTHSKVSSDCLPSYIKATRPVLEIFRTAGYFPDSPRLPIKQWYLPYVKRHTRPHPS